MLSNSFRTKYPKEKRAMSSWLTKKPQRTYPLRFLVGVPGFEPGASWTRRPISNFFWVFYVVFNPFCSNPIHLQTSLTTRFPCVPKRCVVCSVVRNVPPVPAGFFHRQGRGAFFLHRTVCIVTRREGLNKLFPRCPRLRNWRAVNKISEDDMCCYLSNLVWK